MDGVIYAEESAGGPWGALKVTLSSSEAPLYGSGLTSAFRTFSGYPAFRKTSRTDGTQSRRPPPRSPYSGKGLGPGNLLHSALLPIHCICLC
ncbi:mCG119713, isoform CRA_a [Mus musculus]|uniref:Mexneurin n=1 Tax=Mus musculus TaxID=10090 RepID=I6L9U2_MOUSE|nr:mexneurin precursor [Mus musculus]EDL30064.1 mCG119713, isoform CRA_a [Mus musculus]